jgi:arsenite/tail-anchored protein-transporting ATPase
VRILLFTGKGGVGKSTVAAGTAALAAADGHRTLVLSTDAAHSLADAFGCAPGTIGAEPTEVADRLFVQQVDAQLRFEQSWADIQRYLLSVLDVAGVDPVAAEELTVIPGAEEVLALLELRLQAQSGGWDVIVVDCAPTAETLRLLALPEALGWYMHRVFPVERRVMKALRPVLSRAAGVPMPGDTVFDAVERLHAELEEVRELLSGPEASVRLVLTPENVVLAEARRSYTTLSLFGYRVDGVVANRVFPAGGADDWRAGWVMAQDEVLELVEASFAGLPIWRSEYRPREPVGVGALTGLAREVYGADDPLATTPGSGPFRISRTEAGAVLRLALPLVSRAEVDLARNGDDLVVTVGSYRRLITLPSGLSRHRIAGARVEQGELRVRFVEDPEDEAGR